MTSPFLERELRSYGEAMADRFVRQIVTHDDTVAAAETFAELLDYELGLIEQKAGVKLIDHIADARAELEDRVKPHLANAREALPAQAEHDERVDEGRWRP